MKMLRNEEAGKYCRWKCPSGVAAGNARSVKIQTRRAPRDIARRNIHRNCLARQEVKNSTQHTCFCRHVL